MPLQCPHCLSSIVIEGQPPREVVCPSCGSSIQLDPGGTAAWLPAEAPKHLGKFEFLEQIGIGSFGTVYKARDTELDRTVAIKIPRAGNVPRPEDIDRFLREARSAAQLKHPNIVALYDAGETEGTCYLVSEFIQGATLAQQLAGKRIGFRQTAELIAEVAEALHYAHEHGIVHRDLKPSNIMLDLEGRPHLMDFGLAKRAADEITMTLEGQVLGTPAYMAPEQAKGEMRRVDARSDLYSLGVILYELLTGELPFRGQMRMLLVQVIQDEPRPPRRLNDRIPRDLETICLKAMAKEPARRYATARDLADDLRRFLKGEPIQARAVGTWERGWRWAKRRPAMAALLAVSGVAALALVGAGVGIVYNARLEKSLHATEQARQEAELARQREAEQRQRTADALARESTLRYINHIVLAEREWRANNAGRTRQLLAECPQDRRGWEWRYLQRLCRADLLTFENTGSYQEGRRFCGVAFSADGQYLATGGKDKTVEIRDAATGKLLRALPGHTFEVGPVRFSPDGKRLASVGAAPLGRGSGEVKVWDAATGQPILSLNHKTNVSSMAFSPDGRRLAAAYGDGGPGEVKVWDVATGQEIHTLRGHIGPARSVAFSPDGKRLASSCGPRSLFRAHKDPGEIKIWDANTGQEIRTLRGHTTAVWGVAFNPDGRRLASAGLDQTARVWDTMTGQEVLTLRGHTKDVNTVAFSPDGQHLASADDDGAVKVWDATTGQEVRMFRGHAGPVSDMAFSPDGKRLATGSQDGTVKVWDPMEEQEALTLRGYRGRIVCAAFSPDGSRLAAGGMEFTVRIWDPATGQEIQILRQPGPVLSEVWDVAFSPDGRRLAEVCWSGPLRVWDLATGQVVHTLPGHRGGAQGVAFSPDGQRLASGGRDNIVRIWDATTGQELRTLTGHTKFVFKVAFSPDGRHLASASDDMTVKVWDATTGQELRALTGHTALVSRAVFSPDGRNLASASADMTVKLWDLTTGQEPITLCGHTGEVLDVKYSPDGRRLATASLDRTVKVWDVQTYQEILTLRGHTSGIVAVAFSPDGERIASGGDDETVKAWEATPVTAELRVQREAAGLVNRLAAEPLLKEEVITRLRSDASLSEAVRQQALAMVGRYREDPVRFYQASWAVVQKPGAEAAKYRLALHQAEASCRLTSSQATAYRVRLNALGAAQYRVGQYREALDSLTRADGLFSAQFKGGVYYNLAFLAMTHHRLGDKDKAQAALDRLRNTMKNPQLAKSAPAQALLHEAEAVIQQAVVERKK